MDKKESGPTWRKVGRLDGPAGAGVAFSRDGKTILTAGRGEVRVWDAASFKPLTGPMRHGASLQTAVFGPDGKAVLTIGGEAARLWDAAAGRELRAFPHAGRVFAAAFSPDGSKVLTAGQNPAARVWDAGTGKGLLDLPHPATVKFAAFSPDGAKVLTLTTENPADAVRGAPAAAARLWDTRTGREVWKTQVDTWGYGGFDRWLRPVVFSPDAKAVATVSFKCVDVRDVETGWVRLNVETWDDTGPANVLAFSRDGGKLLVAANGVRAWDVATGEPTGPGVRFNPSRWAADALFGPDGRQVLIASGDEAAGVWDLASGRQVVRFAAESVNPFHEPPAIALSADGKRAAVGFPGDGYATIWEVDSR